MNAVADPKVIVALDYPDRESALALARRIRPADCRLKVGMELFTAEGPRLLDELHGLGFEVFLDLKFHDIPNTVAHACKVAADLGVWMLNVHALGGERMMAAAREAVDGATHRPHLIAVTILTSHAPEELGKIGLTGTPEEGVRRLAILARASGLDGVVCSPHEAATLRADHGDEFLLVTPGIRMDTGGGDDQRRTLSPAEAMAAGADYLVIGRPVTRALDPVDALALIQGQIAGG